jgi:aerobic-type carbon monoxide dehydrogenase small subunit (CoxS/CutS family)
MIAFTLNGAALTLDLAGETPLIEVIGNRLRLVGTRFGCGAEQCGACMVLVDAKPEYACTRTLDAVAGRSVTTVEGFGTADNPHPLQMAFLQEQAGQCGYCLSGMLIAGAALRGTQQNHPRRPPSGAPHARARMNARSQENPALPGSLKANSRLSQWIEITPNGRITIRTGKVEIGQGILTALTQIAADELDVALWRVGVRSASTEISPNEGVTSGSRSITESGLALRHVCAAARSIFISVAAQKTGVPPESICIEGGTFIGPGRPCVLAGTEVKRLDLPDKVFGRPRFIHDIRLPNMRSARRPGTGRDQMNSPPAGDGSGKSSLFAIRGALLCRRML